MPASYVSGSTKAPKHHGTIKVRGGINSGDCGVLMLSGDMPWLWLILIKVSVSLTRYSNTCEWSLGSEIWFMSPSAPEKNN